MLPVTTCTFRDLTPLKKFEQAYIYETDPKWALEVSIKNVTTNPISVSNFQLGTHLSISQNRPLLTIFLAI